MTQVRDDIQCEEKSSEEKYALLRQVMDDYDHQESNLIQILHMTQAIFGCIPQEVQAFIAENMKVSVSKISGVVSFYAFFSTQPKGRHIVQVCLGTACYVRGGKKVLEALQKEIGIMVGETSEDRRFTLEVKRCIGACGLAPAVAIDDTVHKRVNPNKLTELLRQYQ